jgi:nicotinamide mononucleotide transporter
MPGLLSVENIMISIGDYPLSWIEFVGTLAYFLSVWLIARKNLLTWPVGILSVILFGILFYQIQLYSDTIEQLYYLGISVYGWVTWNRTKKQEERIPAGFSDPASLVAWAAGTLILSIALTFIMSRIHLWMPRLFPLPASFPWWDAVSTVMSFIAMYLLTIRRTESWVYWIIVDVIAVILYWVKDVRFISIQYIFLLAMASYGLIHWMGNERSAAAEASE